LGKEKISMNTMKWDTSKNIANFNAKSITPSGFFGDSDKNIVEVLNAITEEEIKIMMDFAQKNSSFDVDNTEYNEDGTLIHDSRVWVNRVATGETIMKSGPHIIPVLKNITDRFQKIIEEFFDVEVSPTGPAVVRWPVGARQEPHADKELHEGKDKGKPNAFPWYDIGTVFYYNDNYEGGELYFPKQGVEFKPKAGAAYFFPGDMNYIHGVRPIISGCRYTSPYFWTITKLPEKFNGPKDFVQ
jgi:hypothetical protein